MYKPTGVNVLLSYEVEKEITTKSGIVIASDTVKKDQKIPKKALVEAVGKDTEEVAVGTEVLINLADWDVIILEDKQYLYGPESSILLMLA